MSKIRIDEITSAVVDGLDQYDVLKVYDLGFYDFNMSLLYHDLKDFLKEKFRDEPAVFGPKQRIVFVHDDLDFFLDANLPPFTLYNLQLVLREVDISNAFCIVISNLPNYEKYTKLSQEKLTADSVPITAITSLSTSVMMYEAEDLPLQIEKITSPYCIQSRASRFHRTYFMSQVFKNNLETNGLVSYYNLPINQDDETNYKVTSRAPCHFLSVDPFIRDYPEIVIHQPENQISVREFQNTIPSYRNFIEKSDVFDKDSAMKMQNEILPSALIYCGLETTVTCPEPFLTNISFKGIVHKRPFIILGSPGIIEYLHTLGFKTFNKWWSEDYSKIKDFETRVQTIMDILTLWKSKPPAELQRIANEMSDVLEYNFNHYQTTFTQQQKRLQ